MKIPRFTGSDFKIMFGILIPYSMILNSILYGGKLYSSPQVFILLLITTLLIKIVFWQFHTWVAVALRFAYPNDSQIMRRIGTSLLCFYFMTGIANSTITLIYAKTAFMGFSFNTGNYMWALLSGIILNTFTTFFHEGVSTLEKWTMTLTETEQLKTEYAKSRLEGLKSQIKPHFLFNSINTLSALIPEDSARAEKFLDEMCKVYRYLLRNHQALIDLEEELLFINSYLYLLKSRYGEGLIIEKDIDPLDLKRKLPPFTIQPLLEIVLQSNIISRKMPLHLSMTSGKNGKLQLQNSIQKKHNDSLDTDDSAFHNIVNKFRLLGLPEIEVQTDETSRTVLVPLLSAEQNDLIYERF